MLLIVSSGDGGIKLFQKDRKNALQVIQALFENVHRGGA